MTTLQQRHACSSGGSGCGKLAGRAVFLGAATAAQRDKGAFSILLLVVF